jgi:alpha-tubulin suppressor-like RCC1 family protein
VAAVSSGIGFVLALLQTGQVFASGVNNVGQLGDGTTINRSKPVRVQGLSHVKAISAGGFSSLALLDDGTVMAWGDDQVGQLGDGSFQTDSVVPVKVNQSGVTAISAGLAHELALLTDGTAMAWGFNRAGQLGDGNVGTNRALPVAVNGLTGVAAVSAGGSHSLALLSTGAVMAWGDDEVGELGNGVNPPFVTAPVRVHRLTKATAVSASDTLDVNGSYSLALLPTHTVDDWGATNPPSEVPRAVPGATTIAAIAPNLFLLAVGTVRPFTA